MGDSDRKYRYRATPQMSANQIAEYLNATPQGRTRKIREARFPKVSVIAQYGKAREGLSHFLGDGARSFRHLADATDFLTKREVRPGASDWLRSDSRASIEAIDSFQRAYNRLGFAKLDCREPLGKLPPLDLWPTRITVDLDLTVHVPTAGEKDRVGGIIFLFSRGEKATKARIEKSKIIAGLILTYCSRFLSHVGDPDRELCQAVDVFAQTAYRPAGTFSRGLDSIASAAEEIAVRWKSVPPPADYDGPDPD